MMKRIEAVNFYRNVKGRFDLMRFFFKWDSDYRKDLITTVLGFSTFAYSIATWNSMWDFLAMALEGGIIAVQLGGEMSIMPADYRPSHGGVSYSATLATHIAHDELSFDMSGVLPAPAEAALGFANPFAGLGLVKESPLSSDKVDDSLMLRDHLPWREAQENINFIVSRHQLRYIAIRVLNKKTHTTNGQMLAFFDTADSLMGDRPVTLRKAHYYDALLTVEAFRSRIFRGNLQKEKEVYTDLTTYFPVMKEMVEGQERLRFQPDFIRHVSGHMGITSLLLTENNRVALLQQGSTNAVGANMYALGGSGSFNYSDMKRSGNPKDFRDMAVYALAREVCEETGMMKWMDEVRKNTIVTGFFRWIDRSGLPEFIGLTRAGNVPFSKQRAIDGDEIIRFDEIPVAVTKPEDFHEVMAWVVENRDTVRVALSSLMALHRMTVIAGYNAGFATDGQKEIYRKVADFIAGR